MFGRESHACREEIKESYSIMDGGKYKGKIGRGGGGFANWEEVTKSCIVKQVNGVKVRGE